MVKDSALAQTVEGRQRLAVLNNKTFDSYTLKLKARRTGGLNAFMIPFAVKDSNSYLRAHIGSWWNSACVFEKVENGFDVAGLTDQKRLANPIETGKWYHVRLEIGWDKVDCYLNDSLLMSYREPEKLFALAGRDETNGDIIVKVVNANGVVAKTGINITGNAIPGHEAKLTSLSANELNVENSFANPGKYIPQQQDVKILGNIFEMEWKPYSINILRIKDAGWKK